LNNQLVRVYGSVASIPREICLPLEVISDNVVPDVVATIGALDNPETAFELDAAVDLHVSGNCVSVFAKMELGPRGYEHYIIDHAVPCVLTHIGKYVSHAAALSKGGRGVLLLGASGAGKSTLCAHLIKNGWQALGDDAVGLAIEGNTCVMHPAYPGLRLHPGNTTTELLAASKECDGNAAAVNEELFAGVAGLVAEYGYKTRVNLAETSFQPSSHTAESVILLGQDDSFSATAVGSAELCAALTSSMFFPAAENIKAIERLQLVSDFATRLSGFKIDYPRTLQGLEEMSQWLDSHISAAGF